MREPFWDRMKQRMCRWFGHREVWSINSRAISCGRCRRLLRGPLNLTEFDRELYLPDDLDA